ncbi:hypothetical protein N0V90_010450 [Kalmusia sp. IMI 367209]|nr:hypothetical protein N0V90_010450 [Kalmusia sp. IMI 367209]
MDEINSYKAATLDLRPDVVKFWPHDDRYAVVGTYTLLEDGPSGSEEPVSQQRVGSLNLIEVKDDEINLIQTLSTPFGVYDLQFAGEHSENLRRNDPGLFAVASSTGSIALHRLVPSRDGNSASPHPEISHVHTIQYFPEDILITSLAWHYEGQAISMTLSDGRVCLSRIDSDDWGASPPISVELMQHDFQAWHCSFIRMPTPSHSSFALVSGGDDATLRYTDTSDDQVSTLKLEVNTTHPPTYQIPWIEKKIHQAGVTAVLPIDRTQHGFLLLTGSYDDHIRLLHIPGIGRREVLAEAELGGGVFRIKLVDDRTSRPVDANDNLEYGDHREFTLLVSCMQAGARIVKLRKVERRWQFNITAKFEMNAGTLLYASDCQKAPDAEGKRTIVSTSFESRQIYLWKAS